MHSLGATDMMLYNGYECYRNKITGRFYAIPIGDDFMFNKVVADSATELKAAIDRIAVKPKPNPWELPYSVKEPIAA